MIMAAIVSATLALAASAGLEGTRWGMRPAEVAAVVPGAIALPAPPARLRSTYKMLGHLFTAHFLFDRDDRLTAVRLALRDASRCEALYGELLGRYGSPIEANRPLQNDAWTDPRTGDRVDIRDARADPRLRTCVVTFSPSVPPSGRQGLVDPPALGGPGMSEPGRPR